MMKWIIRTIPLILLVTIWSCEKIDNNPENPFDNQGNQTGNEDTLMLNGIAGLHKNVFAVKCANPTCHDGSFEPDYRTVQSTYSSLVYHPVKKNDAQNSFTYRVVPGNADASWLVYRITTEDMVLGRMPLYAPALSNMEIDAIKKWINDGALDAAGNAPDFPNLAPTVLGYQAFDPNQNRVDTVRVNGWASAMELNANTMYNLAFYVDDDSTETAGLKNQKIEFSLDKDNFVPFTSIPVAMLWDKVTTATLNTANFSKGQTIYFRYYLEDEQGAATQMPNDKSEFWWKEHYSFIIP